MNLWALALRNLARNRRRSLLTLAIVMFGFSSIALAGGFMLQSFSGLKKGTITSGVGHLQLAAPGFFLGIEEKTLEHSIQGEERVAALLRADPRIDAVLPRIDFMGLVTNGTRSVPFLGTGLEPVAEARVMELAGLVKEGRWLEDRAEIGVVLGTGLARALNLKTGESATLLATTPDGVLNALDVPVVGLIDVPIKELNDRYVATSLAAAAQLLEVSDVVSKFVLMLRSEADVLPARDSLLQTLEAAGIPLEARTWEDLAVFYGQVRMLYIAIFGFMGLILVIMVLLACANSMTMATTERIREIGTLRAIGTPPHQVRRMFVAEGALLGFLGSMAGAVTALLIRAALNAAHIQMPPPPGATQGGTLHVGFYATTYLIGLVVMVVTLALAAWFPARRAARLPIVEALSHV